MNFMDAENIVRCQSIFAGPCHCGPGIHINLEFERGKIFATTVLRSAEDCAGLIEQIKASAKMVWGVAL